MRHQKIISLAKEMGDELWRLQTDEETPGDIIEGDIIKLRKKCKKTFGVEPDSFLSLATFVTLVTRVIELSKRKE